ncbi:DUF3891 family protein [Paenibacillus hunanensis]|uniref:DUF3891 family protein n=1 Tax=Paenibacillus hunanensis TaxID=539262 RepID=UPI0020273C69|nr:DUF3891 family protein [Paenibacillus hunanensis]MCL9661213.1 DUF3891 family protein [Paenibacillus hunanensis]
MIWREREHSFIMIRQHDHARVSGEFSRSLHAGPTRDEKRWDEVLLGCEQHDRGWIPLDRIPIWNDAKQRPFSFLDFPEPAKLVFYRYGIDQMEEMSPYAAMLASLHYCALISHYGAEDPFCRAFLDEEQERQERIKALTSPGEDELRFHRAVLELCDDLSLYACLNEPGVDKAHELDWWKDGFDVGKKMEAANYETIMPGWLDERYVELDPFPFQQPVEVTIVYREVSKSSIAEQGLAEAYEASEERLQRIVFKGKQPQA